MSTQSTLHDYPFDMETMTDPARPLEDTEV